MRLCLRLRLRGGWQVMQILSKSQMERWSGRLMAIGMVGFLAFLIWFFAYLSLTGGLDEDLSYDFTVEREEAQVTVRDDGSVDIDYTFVFINHGQLDGIDVGLPNRYYDADSAWARVEIDGVSYEPREVRRSPYVDIGMAVEFTDGCRRAAETGDATVTVRFHVNNPHMVYDNELRDGTAGLRFRPTWFSSDFQRGSTGSLVIWIVGPEGHTDLNATYYIAGAPPMSEYVTGDGRLLVSWEYEDAYPEDIEAGYYDVGMAFPRSAVSTYVEDTFTSRAGEALHSTGQVCLLAWPFIVFALFLTMFIAGVTMQSRARRLSYFDPELTEAGAGPRRDLTAVEAAVVLELPFERVATMILFGMAKKGMVQVDYSETPIVVHTNEEVGEHLYETHFLSAVRVDGTVSKRHLRKGLVKLVEDVEEKMKGFGLEDTRTYYRSICAKAWDQVEAAGASGAMASFLEEENDWLLLDERYDDRMTGLIEVHVPTATSDGPTVDVRTMARDYVSNLRTASSHLVSDVKALTREVTELTNPVPVSEGGGGGSGGGCACACACACAGGGR